MRKIRIATAVVAALGFYGFAGAQESPGNSLAKVRPPPGAMASRVGDGVPWRPSLEAAQEEARQKGMAVFWYVPTVQGSPMDRKPELDLAMRAGPFSWPGVVALLRDHYVPCRGPATGKVQRDLGLLPRRFVEPGFVVLSAEGKLVATVDQLTTLHPEWFEAHLRRLAGLAAVAESRPALEPAKGAEAGFLRGAALFREGRAGEARKVWNETSSRFPGDPMGWKCAAEAEGHGPFARGLEVLDELPGPLLLRIDRGTRAGQVHAYSQPEVVERSLRFLRGMQQEDGGYADSIYDFGGTDSLPNVHAAVTAIAGIALLAWDARDSAALRAAFRHCADDAELNPADRDEIVWAHAYRAQFFAGCIERGYEEAAAHGQLGRAAAGLLALQPESGAWFHEYPNPFATAIVLLALASAERHGVPVPRERRERGVAALLRCRSRQGGFTYGQHAGAEPRAPIPAAAGRMPLCELALLRHGASDADKLAAAVQAAFEHHGQLEETRKYDDHSNALGYGGFFFWYDMQGRSEAILALPDGKQKQEWIAAQRALVLSLPEIDGCFVDSHELGRCYGTAMALWCLALLREK
jgi:hypothetical protein